MNQPVNDLRSALEVDPAAELAGVYRYVGAGGTVKRPTTVDGPAMIFNNVKGHPDAKVVIGVMASRERVARLFGCRKEELGHLVRNCANSPIEPVVISGPASAQEVIHRAEDPDLDLFRLIPAPTNTPVDAEYVIEGEILPGSNNTVEDQNSHTGYAMPEFPGYNGAASHVCWLIKVKAVTHRKNPIMQTCIGPSEEHVNMAGIPTEASILNLLEKALPGKVKNVYSHRAGGGKYMAVLQCVKTVPTDEGKQRQAALLGDIITIPGVRCHPLDPSSRPEYTGSIRDVGISCKTIFDATVPFGLKDHFIRSPFLELDPSNWVPGFKI